MGFTKEKSISEVTKRENSPEVSDLDPSGDRGVMKNKLILRFGEGLLISEGNGDTDLV